MKTKTIETTTVKEFVSAFKRECHLLEIPKDLVQLFLLCLKHALKAKEWNLSVSFLKGKSDQVISVLKLKRSVKGEWSERIIRPSHKRHTISVKPGSHTTVSVIPSPSPLPAKAA